MDQQNQALPGAAPQSKLRLETVIRIAYLCLAVLLILTVVLATRFRQASRWRLTPEWSLLEDRDKQLSDIRKYVTQGVTSTRDYLVNNHSGSGELYEMELRRAKANSTKAFLALNSWTGQAAALTQMDRELADFWEMLDHGRFSSAQQKSENGYDFLHLQLFPVRNQVFNSLKGLSDAVAQDRTAMLSRFTTELNRDLTYIFVCVGAIILICLFMASGNQRDRRNSQRESRRKLREVAEARDNLEQLSGRLLRIQEDERRKISRELHDGIGQTLTALRMEIHQVHFATSGGLIGGAERLLRARKLAEDAVHTVNDMSRLLRPPLLDDLGLAPALAWLTDQFTRRTEIRCRFEAKNLQEHLPDDLRTCVFRVIQEALNNCEKHALPAQVDVAVEQKATTLTICVEDDGKGFDLNQNNAPAFHSGLGILGMRERVVLLGGTMVIRSSPGTGTKLTFTLPVPQIGGENQIVSAIPLSLNA